MTDPVAPHKTRSGVVPTTQPLVKRTRNNKKTAPHDEETMANDGHATDTPQAATTPNANIGTTTSKPNANARTNAGAVGEPTTPALHVEATQQNESSTKPAGEGNRKCGGTRYVSH